MRAVVSMLMGPFRGLILGVFLSAGLSACNNDGPSPPGAAQNQPPAARAGDDRSVAEGSRVVLDGSASSDPDGSIVAWAWVQEAGTAVDLVDAATASASFTAPQVNANAELVFRLTVTDNRGASASDPVTIRVIDVPSTNQAPTAIAGPDQSVVSGAQVTLTGSGSDADGEIVEYAWEQRAGPVVTLSNTGTPTTRFTAPAVSAATTLSFRLTVTDDDGATASDEVNVTVNPPAQNQVPVADAGADQTVDERTTVTLDGSASRDPDGSIAAYAWTQVSGPAVTLSDAGAMRPQFTAPEVPANTQLHFRLRVTDNAGAQSAPDEVVITVRNTDPANQPPVANAGADIPVDENAEVMLDGSASFDPEGGVLTFAWTQSTGPQVALTGADTATPRFTAPQVDVDTVLRFTLTVTDPQNASASASVAVTVRDRESRLPTLSILDAETIEGNFTDTRLRFTVHLAPASTQTVTVAAQTADGTARAGADYVATSATLSFAPGETQKIFAVTVKGDLLPEDDETLQALLSAPVNAVLARNAATGTILDDDGVMAPACAGGTICAGADRRSVTPTQAHIDGVTESRLLLGAKKQRFNLGGSGINPIQNFPDPFAQFGESLTQPAGARVHRSSVHDEDEEIYVRAMALVQGNTRVLFVMLDAIGAGNIIQEQLRARIVEASCAVNACIATDDVVFGQTHSHAGPDLQGLWGGVPQDWIRNTLYAQAGEATLAALRALQPVTLSVAQGRTSDFNNYRRPRVDPAADADDHATLLRAQTAGGRIVGQILQYAAHPTSIGPRENPRTPHADYILGAMKRLEADGGVALYYNGPIADASPSGGSCTTPNPDKYEEVRCRGNDLAGFAAGQGFRTLAPSLAVRHQTVVLPVTNPAFVAAGALGSFNRYYDFTPKQVRDIPGLGGVLGTITTELGQAAPTAETLVSRISIGGAGGVEIATIPGEATNTFGQYIRGLAGQANPGATVMLLGLTQNSFGYIIPEEEFSYIEPSGDAGFVVPFTGYEEFVSLGPLTAPLLRMQGYIPLFDAASAEYLPDYLRGCVDPASRTCLITDIALRLEYIQNEYAARCRSNGAPEPFCALIDPDTPLAPVCRDAGLPDALCGLLGDAPGSGGGDADLAADALQAQLAGCDLLDPAACLLPFPSDQFTTAAAGGSVQSAARGGSGRRVNLSPLATPRNLAGKPVDPTEWNRNDGFSPGALIVTQVPGLSLTRTWNLPEDQIGIANLDLSLGPDAAIQVLEVPVAPEAAPPRRHPVWAELDANAGVLVRAEGEVVPQPVARSPALLIRPGVNFTEGRRYVVVLRGLRSGAGAPIAAQAAFAQCRDGKASNLPPLAARCAALERDVFPVLQDAGIDRDAALYLAWDFTVASTQNQVARLRHMRNDAFSTLAAAPGTDCVRYVDGAACRAPAFTVDTVTETPQTGIARRIEGSITVPSYVVPADPSPLDRDGLSAVVRQIRNGLPGPLGAAGTLLDLVGSASVPPNRLFYNPLDGANPADPAGLAWGDGLPDRSGEMTARYLCQIPLRASPDMPARAGIYGHGLLDSRAAVTYDGVPDLSREYNYMFCAVDLFGFATGDLPNVASVLVDLSNFPVIPDASQQGLLNYLFLARLLRDPTGFASHPAFQAADSGRPLFDFGEVFYDGNSQGGIVGGALLAASADITRGVLGSLGMNYSTLLARSVDFDLYAVPLYLSYPDPTDRNLLFSMMQMLWDRSENNGYAAHIVDNSAFGGPANAAKLDPQFGDHQVTMWSADVMARTMGIPVDASQTPRVAAARGEAKRHPDVTPYFGLRPLDFASAAQTAGGALIVWDDVRTEIPPIGNTAPRVGRDPHDDSAKKRSGRCQKAHFLRSGGRLIDVTAFEFDPGFGADQCPAVPAPAPTPVLATPAAGPEGGGVLGALGQFSADSHALIDAMLVGDPDRAGGALQTAVSRLAANLAGLKEADSPEALLGLNQGIPGTVLQALSAERKAEAVVVPGALLAGWSVPPAAGVANPYPSGAMLAQCPSPFDAACRPILQLLESLVPGSGPVRNAHNGQLVYPLAGQGLPGVPVDEIAAYAWKNGGWVEIPVQVDERMPYFLANGNSTFSIYSGTDPELSYAWDTESWGMTQGRCSRAYDPGTGEGANQGVAGPTPDPIPGLDADDEIVFMAADAGGMAPSGNRPAGVRSDPGQQIALADPLDPATQRYVYLFRKSGGSSVKGQHYVRYTRDAGADEWIDRSRFLADDPEKLGTSNTNYGANLTGTICVAALDQYHGDRNRCSFDPASGRFECPSSDRFPRDGVTVTTANYRWQASGRWMVRDLRVRKPGDTVADLSAGNPYWNARPDLVDRWKGRAFQQSPDSVVSVVGFEDEQVNWEGNASLLGERCGPVRCIRETWGADSGTNVTKTETFYRDAISYRYRVRVHPIPPDGLYTSWDYNRAAMVPTPQEAAAGVPAGRYYTILRPQGVVIDGVNDDTGNVDGFTPLFGYCPSPDAGGAVPPNADGRCPAFFDAADPTFNPPLAFDNWEQVSGKGNGGSLVYTFLLRGATSLLNPLVVPYYRDDACLDDGTGDDPVARPYPGDNSGSARVRDAYVALARQRSGNGQLQYVDLACSDRQGAHGAHGLHFFVTHDSDNLMSPLATTEIDGEQWQFIVPTVRPQNIAEPYANVARFPLQPVVAPVP